MFRVRWTRPALNELASLWIAADSGERKSITRATRSVDQRLAVQPLTEGESRPNGRRIRFEAPLGIIFRVSSNDLVVRILEVWYYT